MSAWRQVAISHFPKYMETRISQSFGVFDFWGNLHSEIGRGKNIGRGQDKEQQKLFLVRLGEYCNWYVPVYLKNSYMVTAFCYGFAEDLSTEEYESISPFLSATVVKNRSGLHCRQKADNSVKSLFSEESQTVMCYASPWTPISCPPTTCKRSVRLAPARNTGYRRTTCLRSTRRFVGESKSLASFAGRA